MGDREVIGERRRGKEKGKRKCRDLFVSLNVCAVFYHVYIYEFVCMCVCFGVSMHFSAGLMVCVRIRRFLIYGSLLGRKGKDRGVEVSCGHTDETLC